MAGYLTPTMYLTQNHYITNNNWNLLDFLAGYVSLYVSLSTCLPLCLFAYVTLSTSLYVYVSLYLHVSMSTCRSLYVSLHVPNCGFWQHDSYYHFYENYRLSVTQNHPLKCQKMLFLTHMITLTIIIENNRPILAWYLSPTVDFDSMVAISACIKIIGLWGKPWCHPLKLKEKMLHLTKSRNS